MSSDLPLWSIPLGMLASTLLFFLAEHMNYSIKDWVLGNGIIVIFIGLIYIGGYIIKKFSHEDKK